MTITDKHGDDIKLSFPTAESRQLAALDHLQLGRVVRFTTLTSDIQSYEGWLSI